ncbi:MAG: protein phosphatase CheZ [Kiloniellales bacterium]|nr:protein phosphatase CheZ [Kiloniellales bacterium]
MSSISGDISSINQRLYSEIEALARFINTAKGEIAALRPSEIKDRHLATASDELDEIVNHTEQATNSIFEAVETIEGLCGDMTEPVAEKITDAVTTVYEACSFQDITGQRIGKIVSALHHIDDKIEGLLEAFGRDLPDVPEVPEEEKSKRADGKSDRPDEHLMNGPQLSGEGKTQDEIDALLGFD